MTKPEYHVASFSGGKDSTAMVLRMIELGWPLDEVIFCDTSMEFPSLLDHVGKIKKVVEAEGIKFTIVRAPHTFEFYLLEYKVKKRKNPNLEGLPGRSWPGPRMRWCTKHLKTEILDNYKKALLDRYTLRQYIGIAADEANRTERKQNQDPSHRHPLIEWGWTEADALNYCKSKGYDWGGLYDIFSRVSCWCCPLQGFSELRKLREHFPDLWDRLKQLDAKTWRDFRRGYTVDKIEQRFDLEDALTAGCHSIKDRAFYTDLKRLLSNEATAEEILRERRGTTCL
jgi:3'-phosphoadenosine 5'-phosphosulfate sulfotransferase (PAPS reductase)/FAD synthetase